MKLLMRRVTTKKTVNEVIQILKSCAYDSGKVGVENSQYSMYCSTRRNGEYLSLVHVAGGIYSSGASTLVELDVYADYIFFLGLAIVLLGTTAFICSLVLSPARWYVYLGLILLGVFPIVQTLCRDLELLDIIEHKLTRI